MIESLRLQHFRSYDDASFEFDPGVNIIVGPNASGKTNLLEAILVMARGGSYRARDSELVQFDRDWARLDALVDDAPRIVKLIQSPRPAKVYDLDGTVLKRLTLAHRLPVVLFEPNHLLLLTGSPDKRRDYLDELLEQTTPGYGTTIRAYRRTLMQRNSLLKQGRPAPAQLFPWNVRLSELAGTVARARHELVAAMNQSITPLYRDLSHTGAQVVLNYHARTATEHYESRMMQQLEARLDDDVQRGFTSFGPHREDFTADIDGHPADEVASRGETRTLVLALKIIELQTLQALRGTPPLLLLDDVFSELDGTRRRALTTYLQPYQTFITTTDADVVVKHFTETSRILPLDTTKTD